MSYTADQATDAIADLDINTLSPKEIEQELKSIINQLDITPQNTNNRAATVNDIVDNPNFHLLNNTFIYFYTNSKVILLRYNKNKRKLCKGKKCHL